VSLLNCEQGMKILLVGNLTFHSFGDGYWRFRGSCCHYPL